MRNIAEHKPHLVWFGAILGMDLYIDICGQREADKKVLLAQQIMMKAFNMGEAEIQLQTKVKKEKKYER